MSRFILKWIYTASDLHITTNGVVPFDRASVVHMSEICIGTKQSLNESSVYDSVTSL